MGEKKRYKTVLFAAFTAILTLFNIKSQNSSLLNEANVVATQDSPEELNTNEYLKIESPFTKYELTPEQITGLAAVAFSEGITRNQAADILSTLINGYENNNMGPIEGATEGDRLYNYVQKYCNAKNYMDSGHLADFAGKKDVDHSMKLLVSGVTTEGIRTKPLSVTSFVSSYNHRATTIKGKDITGQFDKYKKGETIISDRIEEGTYFGKYGPNILICTNEELMNNDFCFTYYNDLLQQLISLDSQHPQFSQLDNIKKLGGILERNKTWQISANKTALYDTCSSYPDFDVIADALGVCNKINNMLKSGDLDRNECLKSTLSLNYYTDLGDSVKNRFITIDSNSNTVTYDISRIKEYFVNNIISNFHKKYNIDFTLIIDGQRYDYSTGIPKDKLCSENHILVEAPYALDTPVGKGITQEQNAISHLTSTMSSLMNSCNYEHLISSIENLATLSLLEEHPECENSLFSIRDTIKSSYNLNSASITQSNNVKFKRTLLALPFDHPREAKSHRENNELSSSARHYLEKTDKEIGNRGI